MPLPPVRPLTVAIALAAGIAISPMLDRAGVPPSLRWVATVAIAILASRRAAATLPAIALAGAAHGAPPDLAPSGRVDDHRLDTVRGEVAGPVVKTAHGWGGRIGGTWVWSPEPLVPGEQVAATGYLATPAGPRGPGLPDPAWAVRSRGAELELAARKIDRLGDAPDWTARAWRWAAAIQVRWSTAIDDAGGDADARAALRGIAVGDRSAVPTTLDDRWRASGIFHVLSVSGLHLAVVAGLLFALLRRLIAGSPWGGRVRPAAIAAPIALVVAIAYTLITGAQLATLRALVVVGVMLVGALLDRPTRLVDALGIAAIAILAWRPADLFDPGFQLSFTAALALALRPAREPGIRRWIGHQLATSFWVALATAPVTAYHFHQVAAGGVIGNLLLTPAVELIALPLALVGVVTGWDVPIELATEIVGWIDRGAGALATVMPIGEIAIVSPLTLGVLVAATLLLAARRIPRLAGWIAICVAWSLGRAPAPDGALRATFVDVGQGDAAIVELPDGEVWLIDAGGLAGRDPAIASRPGRTIARVLAAYGHARIDVAIISHPHPDHYQGLAAIDVPIDELWFVPDADPAFAAIANQLAARGTRLVHPSLGVARRAGEVELATWAPRGSSGTTLAADPVRSVNDNSLVVTIRYRDRTLLFTGDIEREGEDLLVADGLPHADIVKAAHHGSPTSSSDEFVAATRPAVVVISCGRGNHFGFPSPSVIDRWRAVGASVARTDTEGTVVVTVDDAGTITIERSADVTRAGL